MASASTAAWKKVYKSGEMSPFIKHVSFLRRIFNDLFQTEQHKNKTNVNQRFPLPLSPRVIQQSTSAFSQKLTSETYDSSKKQVVLAETASDSLGVLKSSLTVRP